jgi:hypothetical protein
VSLAVAAACPVLALPAAPAGAVAGAPARHGHSGRRSDANGIALLTAGPALARGLAALRAEQNVVVAGTLHLAGGSFRLALVSAGRGTRCSGTLTPLVAVPALGLAGTLGFVQIGPVVFLDGGKRYWQNVLGLAGAGPAALESAVIDRLSGRWVRLPATTAAAFARDEAAILQPDVLMSLLTHDAGVLHKAPPGPVRGIDSLPVVARSGATVWLAMSGVPRPLEVSSGSAASPVPLRGDLVLSYPDRLHIVSPPGAESFTQLAG